jgi:hypothetical protein
LLIQSEAYLARGLHYVRSVRRLWTILLISALSLSGVAVAADALVVTPREELDGFLETVSRREPQARTDAVIGHMDPDAVPLRLNADGKLLRFGNGETGALVESVRQVLGVFDSPQQELLQHSIKIEGERASVTTRMGDSSYEQTVIYELALKDGRWWIRSLRTL